MKKIILIMCMVVSLQGIRADELDHLFHDDLITLDFKVHSEPEKKGIALKDVPKLAAVYAYYNYVKPFLVAVKIMKEDVVTG